MKNTLPDLRLTIAEGMTALAHAKADHWQPYMEAELMRLYNGAETLRWCAAREAPTVEELQAEVERLEDIIEAVDEAARPSESLSAAKRLAEIRELMA